MKEKTLVRLAQTMRRANVPINRPRKPQEKTDDTPTLNNSTIPQPTRPYGGQLDSWEPRYREAPTAQKPPEAKKVPEIQKTDELANTGYVEVTRTAKRMATKKARKSMLSIAVSPEEQELIRAHVASINSSFSTWAREALFRAMGRKVPARPNKIK